MRENEQGDDVERKYYTEPVSGGKPRGFRRGNPDNPAVGDDGRGSAT